MEPTKDQSAGARAVEFLQRMCDSLCEHHDTKRAASDCDTCMVEGLAALLAHERELTALRESETIDAERKVEELQDALAAERATVERMGQQNGALLADIAFLKQRLADAEAARDWNEHTRQTFENQLNDKLMALREMQGRLAAAEERAEQAEGARDEWRDMAVDVRDNKWLPTLERAEHAEAACATAKEEWRALKVQRTRLENALAKLRAEVVEECARVAERPVIIDAMTGVVGTLPGGHEIAAAIRKLSPAPREEEEKR